MRYGDLISGFMKQIGLHHVIVVLSDKYLQRTFILQLDRFSMSKLLSCGLPQ
jgi:hypothetical protein